MSEISTVYGAALRYFAEVARTGSLAAASETLHVAVSAISRQIARLEEEVGAPLFRRMPRGMVLTKSGEIFAEHVRRTLLEADTVLSEISAARAPEKGVVRLGYGSSLALAFLPALMAKFHRESPSARFVVRSGLPAQVEQWVSTGEVDVGILCLIGRSTAVNTVFSARTQIYALCRLGHPLAGKAQLTLDDMLEYPIAISERGSMMRQMLDWCCVTRGKRLDPVLVTDNPFLIRQFTALSDGITLGGKMLPDNSSGTPVILAKEMDDPLLTQPSIHIVTMPDRRLSRTVERFVEALKGVLSETP